MRAIRILVVDDHRIFLEGLVKVLRDDPSLEIVGMAKDGRETLRQVELLKPDVVLMDISMPNLNGIEATRLIKKTSSETKVLVLSMHESEEFLRRVLEAGASGYLVKDTSAEELFAAIKSVDRGEVYLSPSVARWHASGDLNVDSGPNQRAPRPPLTAREREVLQLIAEGRSREEIARSLHISPATVQTHRRHMMKKLNCHRVSELIRYAIQNGILPTGWDKPTQLKGC
jgi:two-component system response regulator NreC